MTVSLSAVKMVESMAWRRVVVQADSMVGAMDAQSVVSMALRMVAWTALMRDRMMAVQTADEMVGKRVEAMASLMETQWAALRVGGMEIRPVVVKVESLVGKWDAQLVVAWVASKVWNLAESSADDTQTTPV